MDDDEDSIFEADEEDAKPPLPKQETLWVRIKPRNEKKGIVRRRHLAFGIRFDEKAGWHIVPRVIELSDGNKIDFGNYLRRVRNEQDDPDSPPVFDVMTEKEARELDEAERKAAEVKATAVNARPVRAMTGAATEPGEAKLPAPTAQPPRRPRGRPPKTQPAR